MELVAYTKARPADGPPGDLPTRSPGSPATRDPDKLMTCDIETPDGASILHQTAVSGGEVCDAAMVELSDGRKWFVKRHRSPPPGFFAAEARGLSFLRVAGGPRVPEVQQVTEGALVLEWIPRGGAVDRGDFGQRLAALHRAGRGLPWGNAAPTTFLGTLQLEDNTTRTTSWPSFWRTHRMAPLLAIAHRRKLLSPRLSRKLDRHLELVESLLGHCPQPARIHGDLWGGNRRVDARAESWIYDPAAQVGDREVDLAMMSLFGGFSRAELDAVVADDPLPPGAEDRRRAYQAFYLLVHVLLQGAHWGRQLEDSLRGLC